jgi:hypothetical protein
MYVHLIAYRYSNKYVDYEVAHVEMLSVPTSCTTSPRHQRDLLYNLFAGGNLLCCKFAMSGYLQLVLQFSRWWQSTNTLTAWLVRVVEFGTK